MGEKSRLKMIALAIKSVLNILNATIQDESETEVSLC